MRPAPCRTTAVISANVLRPPMPMSVGIGRRRADAIVAMTRRAMLKVERLSALAAGVRREPACPREIVGIDVVQAGVRIERLPAPLGAAVESWKHHGLTVHAERHELPAAL